MKWLITIIAFLSILSCFNDTKSWSYRLEGDIRSAKDSTFIDSVIVKRHFESGILHPSGFSREPVYVADTGRYHYGLYARVSDEEADETINEATFVFQFRKTGFKNKDTTFKGVSLYDRYKKWRQYDASLPVIYLEPE